VNEIDPAIKELLTRARLTAVDAEGDWEDVLRRAHRRRIRRFPVQTRGLLLAAAVLIGLGAVAQAQTGIFHFITRGGGSRQHPSTREVRLLRVTDAIDLDILGGFPRGQVTGVAFVSSTTAMRIAHVFGGSAARYPARAGIVLIKGPFSIPLYLGGCQGIPAACPVPIGKWAWVAYTVLRSPKTGPMADLPNAHFLRIARLGTPLPKLQGLGQVSAGYVPGNDPTTVTRQHQGTLTIVKSRGSALTEARVLCAYHHRAYTTQLCRALAKYVAYRHVPHPNDPTPAQGDWTRVSGTIGGWRGNLVITSQTLSPAPESLRIAVTKGLAVTHGKPITKIPPPLLCVVNPFPCFHPVSPTLNAVMGEENHHGLDVRSIPPTAMPSRYRNLIPANLKVIGAVTNAGRASVSTRGYVFSIFFSRAVVFPIRQPFLKMLGQHWGVFPDVNVLTLYHPFTPQRGPHYAHNQTGYALIRDLDRLTTAR
jgi:hypothetical protein